MFVSINEQILRCIDIKQNCAECPLHKDPDVRCEGITSMLNRALTHLDVYQRKNRYLSQELITQGKISHTGAMIYEEQAIKEAKYLQSLRDKIDMLRKQAPVMEIHIDEEFKKECEHEIKVAKQEACREFAYEIISEFKYCRSYTKSKIESTIFRLLRDKLESIGSSESVTFVPVENKKSRSL